MTLELRKMEVDYRIVVGKDGKPEHVVLNWSDFQHLLPLIEALPERPATSDTPVSPVPLTSQPVQESVPQVTPAPQPVEEDLPPPAQYQEGGDYQPLSSIGVQLPDKIQHRKEADDPIPEYYAAPESEGQEEIRLGKRIR